MKNNKRVIKNKLTVTIGIPAYNEGCNIVNLLESIIQQESFNYILEKIIVLSDASSDETEQKTIQFARKDKRVMLLTNSNRSGKAHCLNKLHELNKSDLLLTMDGDVVFSGKHDLEQMVAVFQQDKKALVVAARQLPVNDAKGFIAKALYTNYLIWTRMKESVNHGENIFTLTGSASLLKKSFAKSLVYPAGTINDQTYLYLSARKKKGYRFCNTATILQRSVATFIDFRSAYFRSEQESKALRKYSTIPWLNKFSSIFLEILRSPFYAISAVFLNLFVKFFPYEDALQQKGMWTMAVSTKKGILWLKT
jgi:glycosyltransferase involved in cell wall biosynthesis